MNEEHEDTSYTLRIGSLVLHNVGQLLPHQLQSAVFHNRNFIYPVCFEFDRIIFNRNKRMFSRLATQSQDFIGRCDVRIDVVPTIARSWM